MSSPGRHRALRATPRPDAKGPRHAGRVGTFATARELQLGGRATRCGDRLAGATAELVRGDVHLDGQLAVAENLHQRVLANQALGDQLGDAELATLRERLGDIAEVDHGVLGAEPVAEALELGQPHVDRHLPTLEGHRHVLTRLGALGTAARGLTLGAFAASDAGLGGLRPLGRLQVVKLDGTVISRPPLPRRGGART